MLYATFWDYWYATASLIMGWYYATSCHCIIIVNRQSHGCTQSNLRRYVEIYESDEDDLARALKRGAVNKRAYGGSDAPIVKLRGLPFNTSEEDVKNFFSGLSIVDLTVRILVYIIAFLGNITGLFSWTKI